MVAAARHDASSEHSERALRMHQAGKAKDRGSARLAMAAGGRRFVCLAGALLVLGAVACSNTASWAASPTTLSQRDLRGGWVQANSGPIFALRDDLAAMKSQSSLFAASVAQAAAKPPTLDSIRRGPSVPIGLGPACTKTRDDADIVASLARHMPDFYFGLELQRVAESFRLDAAHCAGSPAAPAAETMSLSIDDQQSRYQIVLTDLGLS